METAFRIFCVFLNLFLKALSPFGALFGTRRKVEMSFVQSLFHDTS
jgi:hypothetical protein